MALASLRKSDPTRIGQYRLTARLGAGGMGVAYLGETKDGSRVAVKVMRPEVGDDPEFRARFRREVELLTRVRGHCTVRVVEADTESTSPYLVTEYAEGQSLSEQVKHNGPLGPEMVYGLATGMAEALVAIHSAGVVHRDLKPGNVLLTRHGPKVIDFGIAQALDGTVLTRTGVMLGSPGFMAPEQVVGTPGQAADIFSWGLTVAYAASGKVPFGTGPAEVLPYRVVHGSPDIDAVPAVLRPLVEAAVAKDPNARPTARDLLAWLTSGVTEATGHPADAEVEDAVPTRLVLSRTWQPPEPVPAAVSMQDARPPRRRRPVATLAGAATLTVVIAAGAAYAINAGEPAGAATTLPTVTFGSFSGQKPSAIVMDSASGGGIIQNIHWTSWTAIRAVGEGQYTQSQYGTTQTQVSLSAPVQGRYTRMSETVDGQLLSAAYPDTDWPTGASPVGASPTGATAPCTIPTPAALLAAFRAAQAPVQQYWVNPVELTGFADASCWKNWVTAIGTGKGVEVIVFSVSGGLHPLSNAEMQQFGDVVCSDPGAPGAWKSPKTSIGPAVCL